MPKIPDVETGVYADDRVYFTSSGDNKITVERLNKQLKSTSDWCKKRRMKINAKKSQSILFGYKLKNRNIDPPNYNNEPINWEDEAKYLGVTLDIKN